MFPPEKKKGLAALILEKAGPKPDAPSEDDGAGDGMKSAAEDLIAAIKQDDPDGVAAALKSAFSIADADDDASDEGDDAAGEDSADE